VQHPLLQPRQRADALVVRAPPQAPPERRPRVAAEVVAVPPVDRLEEEVDLDPLGVVV
jgi:hypothetical protein